MSEKPAISSETAALGTLGDAARVSVDDAGRGFAPVVWIDFPHARRLVDGGGEFWMTWDLGQPVYVRFRLAAVAFSRAAFAPVEVRLALDPAQRPEGVWWPFKHEFPTQAPSAVMPQRAAGPVCERCGAQPLDVTALLDEKVSTLSPIGCTQPCPSGTWVGCDLSVAGAATYSAPCA